MSPPVWTGPVDLIPVGRAPLVGDVVEFDDPRGLGVVEYGPGRRVGFHCTAITDGSRTIAVGTVVAFVVTAGRLGRLEARYVRPLPGVVSPGSSLAPVGATGGLPTTAYAGSGSTPAPGTPEAASGSSPGFESALPAPFDWSVTGSTAEGGSRASPGRHQTGLRDRPVPEAPVAEAPVAESPGPVAEPPVAETPVSEPPPVGRPMIRSANRPTPTSSHRSPVGRPGPRRPGGRRSYRRRLPIPRPRASD